MNSHAAALVLASLLVCGCSSSADDPASAPTDGGLTETGTETANDADPTGCMGTSAPDGRFGEPAKTFALPCPNADRECYYPDLAKSFPEVDWANLERLYLPAGEYRLLNFGGLPERDPKKPLVITNKGGQVRLSGTGGYGVAFNGGSGWVLTGRYDPVSKTGDAAFPGHANGAYATSRGRYGIDVSWSPTDPADPPLVAVGKGAHDFELEFLEIHKGNFSALTIASNDDVTPIHHVKLHDLYIHDMQSEGFYLGSTRSPVSKQHEVRDFEIYNNRVARTGTEMLQLGEMAGGIRVHHNVFFLGALAYRAPFSGDGQDNGAQLMYRRGKNEIDHNVIIGGAHSDLIILGSTLAGETPAVASSLLPVPGDELSIHHNYVAGMRWRGVYFAPRGDTISKVRFANNLFRGSDQTYETDSRALSPSYYLHIEWGFGTGSAKSPVFVEGNTYDGPQKFVSFLSAINGTADTVTATDNVQLAFGDVPFVDTGLPMGTDPRRVTRWAAKYRYGSHDGEAIPYAAGDIVTAGDEHLYRAKVATKDPTDPRMSPAVWEDVGVPKDDLRQSCEGPLAGLGLLDAVSSK